MATSPWDFDGVLECIFGIYRRSIKQKRIAFRLRHGSSAGNPPDHHGEPDTNSVTT